MLDACALNKRSEVMSRIQSRGINAAPLRLEPGRLVHEWTKAILADAGQRGGIAGARNCLSDPFAARIFHP